jgi:hypothetical protein
LGGRRRCEQTKKKSNADRDRGDFKETFHSLTPLCQAVMMTFVFGKCKLKSGVQRGSQRKYLRSGFS